jgi:cytochrome c-type biogenesis protein CcmH
MRALPLLLALAATTVAAATATPALAISDPAEMLKNPAQEKRAEAIGGQLRCLVCQNESIEDSGADLARDLRKIVRERVVAGDSDRQIIDWMVARYGNFVRLSPPLDAATVLLWGSPAIALVVGAAVALIAYRRAAKAPPRPPAPLDGSEQARLEQLTGS